LAEAMGVKDVATFVVFGLAAVGGGGKDVAKIVENTLKAGRQVQATRQAEKSLSKRIKLEDYLKGDK
jgi:hypothetical protein